MKILGTNSMFTELDIGSLRIKIFDIVFLLCGDEIYATKVASCISSFSKYYLQFGHITTTCVLDKLDPYYGVITFDFGKTPKGFNANMIPKSYFLGVGKIYFISSKLEIRFRNRYNFDFHTEAKKIFSIKSVKDLMEDIKLKNVELESSLHNLKNAKDLNARMESELEVAKDIQMGMLSTDFPKSEKFDIYAKLIPAREVGGDFYDFFFVDENNFCLVVGDVSGKGVPAALMMAVCKTLIKSNTKNSNSTASILTHVNNEMAKDNVNSMFVTVFIGLLNTNTGDMTYSNAGHNPTFIKRIDGSLIKLTTLHGVAIAAMEDMHYAESTVKIMAGDVIFAYTDGIPEAHNAKGEMYTDKQLYDMLLEYNFVSAKETVKDVVASVDIFEGEAEQFDDITALCLEFHGNLFEN